MTNNKKLDSFRVHTMVYETKLTKKYENREKWERPNELEVRSYIPGTVIELQVKIGQEVKEGDNLMILEAMKMRNQIIAPFDAKIKEIRVNPGDKIPKNELMILLE